MPATVVIVHDDDALAAQTKVALEQKGVDVAVFAEPMSALAALEHAQSADLLVTRVNFGPGKPHGVSLALMARTRRPKIKVLFVTRPENRQHTEGLGELLPTPATAADVVAAAERLLSGIGGAAPLQMAPRQIRMEQRRAAPPAMSLPVVGFSRQTIVLLHRARHAAERTRRALQFARELQCARLSSPTWGLRPVPL